MKDNEILNLVISRMTEEGMWFTTKNDPTFVEASSYYELDEFGDPTEKTISKIAKEVKDKIGDGAIELEDAIEVWLSEQQANYRIAYIDNLVTNFEPKPVVDQIKAYQTPTEMSLNEGVKVDGLLSEIPEELFKSSKIKPWTDKEWSSYYTKFKDSRIEGYQYAQDENRLVDYIKFLKDEAKGFGLDGLEFTSKSYEDDISKVATEYANKKEKKYKNINNITESKKLDETKLSEMNTKSLNIIGAKLSDPDFDNDSEDGQIVLRTSQLFNALSDKGIDADIYFDNGESQTTMTVPQGGKINITIRSSSEPIKAFLSGDVQLDDELVESINTILEILTEV